MSGPADYSKFDAELAKVNEGLGLGLSRAKIERRGGGLSLVACLPGKGTDTKRRSRRISPGIPANAVGLKTAKGLALKLSAELVNGEFQWSNWVADTPTPLDQKTCAQWVREYRIHLDRVGALTGDPETRDRQWRRDHWNPALKWLPQDGPLTDQAIIIAALHHDAVNESGRPRRSRQLACIRLGQFAKWAGVAVDLAPYRGKYSPSQVDRNIPSDADIEKAIASLTNPGWKWIAGMMATFGLRDHECWFATLSQDDSGWIAVVSEGKTGDRTARALHPHWVDLFNLPNGKAPDIKCRSHDEYGERTARHFKRSRVGFAPYDLRHAYAIRGSLGYKIPVAVMAAWLGHSPAVFLRIYSKHLSGAVMDQAYRDAIGST